MGRHTVTGMLAASGKQFVDWTKAYRLFSCQRINVETIFKVLQKNTMKENKKSPYLVAHMDDTVIKKTGKKIPGTSWRRDALGPAFQTNFIWGQRFIQVSMALPDTTQAGRSRAIPVDFHHCPTPVKPKKTAMDEEWVAYKHEKNKTKLSRQGRERIALLRKKLNEQGAEDKTLVMSVDGSYTNSELLKGLPKGVTLIGRIRKDTKLYSMPEPQARLGRKKVYGDKLPTPEQIRQSDFYPYQKVTAWAAGKMHKFNIKVVKNVRWRSAGEKHDLMLIAIRPLGYRLSKGSKILYRNPAYLIVTKTDLSIEAILQAYIWRWEIEVNFREEKTILGCGQAQVRNPSSAEGWPAFMAAIYGLLHLAYHRSNRNGNLQLLPRPKWYPMKNIQRVTTGDLINNLRAQLCAKATNSNFSDFVNLKSILQSQRNSNFFNEYAPFYLRM